MMMNMSEYPIAGWHYCGLNRSPEEMMDTWHELGLNLVTLICSAQQKELVLRALDRAETHGIKLILMDGRTHYDLLRGHGEEAYRRGVQAALEDYGTHPALFGFYVGDEPDSSYTETACRAVRICQELAPHLNAFLNLLPWFDWLSERLGTKDYASYLDRICRESNAGVIGYDCYTQMKSDRESGYADYFNNLREHYLSFKRNGVPFINTVLCAGHVWFRHPSKEDLRWQLSSSVAHGAAAVMWFHIELLQTEENYLNAPINPLGDRTEDFGWMREVNWMFRNHMGRILSSLSIDQCWHVGKAYGGMPLFEPFESILDISSKEPLIASSFHDPEGQLYYVICSNTPDAPTYVTMKFKDGISLEKCAYGNVFVPMPGMRDTVEGVGTAPEHSVGFFLTPGQMILLRETKKI